MSAMMIGAMIGIVLTALLILSNEVFGLLSSDRFPTTIHKIAAYTWFAILALFLGVSVAGSAEGAKLFDPEQVPFFSLFTLHAILVVFLAGWWILAGMKPLRNYLNLQSDNFLMNTGIGVAVGLGGWLFTMIAAMGIGLIVQALGMLPEDMQPAPMIDYMINLAWWQKGLIVLSAMTTEEFFFRGWLQKRFGLVVSTVIFAISHAGYGQPMFLIGVTAISLVIGATFYFTRRLWPCIIAHGVFDAVQIFIIVPAISGLM